MALDLIAEDEDSQSETVHILRQVYTEQQLGKKFRYHQTQEQETTTCCASCSQVVSTKWNRFCAKLTCRSTVRWLLSMFPIIFWLPKYRPRKDLLKDFSAGLTLGVMQIPQGMAYAMLTTLPPITGLYVSLVPILVYLFLGTSPHISVGTFAIVSLMVGETVQSQVEPVISQLERSGVNVTLAYENELRVKYAVVTSLAVGVIQFFMGLFRIGFITIYLSDSLISGFTTAAGFHILTSQAKHFFGLDVPRDKTSGFFSIFKTYYYLFKDIENANMCSIVVGALCTVILFIIKYLAQKYSKKLKGAPIPAELIVVALGAGISYGVNFKDRWNVKILDSVPKGMPPFEVPDVSLLPGLFSNAIVIAVVSFAINISLAKAFAKKNNYTVDANQELYAYAGMNVVGSFLSCFTSAASLSRSLIQENLGSSQLAGAFSSLLIVLTLVVLAPIFEPLPNAVLAAIVLVALKGVFRQFSTARQLWKISKVDLFVWCAAFVAVIVMGVDYGLATGLGVNILTTVVRNSWPSSDVVGQIQDSEIYRNKKSYLSSEIPGVQIFQYHGPLFYANVEHFQSSVYTKTMNPRKCEVVELEMPTSERHRTDTECDSDTDSGQGNHPERRRTRRNTSPPQLQQQVMESALEIELRSSKRSSMNSAQRLFLTHALKPHSFLPVSTRDGRQLRLMHTLVLDFTRVAYVDTMGVSAIAAITSAYRKREVHVLLANCDSSVLRMLSVGGYIEAYGEDIIYATVQDAVMDATSTPREHAITPILKAPVHVFEDTITNSTIGQVLANDIPTSESTDRLVKREPGVRRSSEAIRNPSVVSEDVPQLGNILSNGLDVSDSSIPTDDNRRTVTICTTDEGGLSPPLRRSKSHIV